jgi:hypothetical protein
MGCAPSNHNNVTTKPGDSAPGRPVTAPPARSTALGPNAGRAAQPFVQTTKAPNANPQLQADVNSVTVRALVDAFFVIEWPASLRPMAY